MEQREMLMYGGAAALVIVIIIIVIMTMKKHKKIKTSGATTGSPAATTTGSPAATTTGSPAATTTGSPAAYTYPEDTHYANLSPGPDELPWACIDGQDGDYCGAHVEDAAKLCDSLDLCVAYMVNPHYPTQAQLVKNLPSGGSYPNMKTYVKPASGSH